MGGSRGLLNLGFTGLWTTVGDVVVDGVVKEHRVLGHDADGAAHARLGQGTDIVTVHADGALLDIVETKQ